MKPLFKIGLGMLIVHFSVINTTRAQDTSFKTLPTITITAASKVNREVSNAFKNTFPEAKEAVWTKMDKNYLVKFISRDQNNRALFTNKGQLVYHIRYGQEQNLPDDVRNLIKKNYANYNITNVIYVSQDERKIWVVNLEDQKKLIVARVEEGELEQVDSYNKS